MCELVRRRLVLVAEERCEEADQKSIDEKVDGTQQGKNKKRSVVRSCKDVHGWQVNGANPAPALVQARSRSARLLRL